MMGRECENAAEPLPLSFISIRTWPFSANAAGSKARISRAPQFSILNAQFCFLKSQGEAFRVLQTAHKQCTMCAEVIKMAKTANINIRIEPEIKAQAEDLFSSFGISISDAVNIFLRKALMDGGIPFAVKTTRFNAETEAAMAEAREIAAGHIAAKRYRSAAELMRDVDADEV